MKLSTVKMSEFKKMLPLVGGYMKEVSSGRTDPANFSMNHHKDHPVFKAEVAPGFEAIFISCPRLVQQIMRNEGSSPMKLIPEPWIIFNQLTNTKRGLFFLDGDEWHDLRQKLNPLLLRTLDKEVDQTIDYQTEKMVNGWNQSVLDAEFHLYQWSIKSMLGILLGNDVVEETPDHAIHEIVTNVIGMSTSTAKLMTEDVRAAAENQTKDWKTFYHHTEATLKSVSNMVSNALLTKHGGLAIKFKENGLSEDEIVRNLVDLLIAASDTTSLTATWTLHKLSLNRDIQEKIKDLGDGDDQIRNKYIQGFIKEIMRLYPVAPFLTRIVLHDRKIEYQSKTYSISAGTLLLVSSYAMGRIEKYFNQADEIIPERWMRTEKTNCPISSINKEERKLRAFSILPFGHGARACIGKRIAEKELLVLIDKVIQKWILFPW